MTENVFSGIFGWKMTLAGYIEKHSVTIFEIYTIIVRVPWNLGVTTYTVTVFDLKKTYSRSFFVTTRVEILAIPPMVRSSVEESSDKKPVAQ